MSSKKKAANVSIEVLELQGRGHIKKKANADDTVFRRRIRSDHGYPLITLPKFFLKLGLKMHSEVIIEKRGSNPLDWEIIIKPAKRKKEPICKSV